MGVCGMRPKRQGEPAPTPSQRVLEEALADLQGEVAELQIQVRELQAQMAAVLAFFKTVAKL